MFLQCPLVEHELKIITFLLTVTSVEPQPTICGPALRVCARFDVVPHPSVRLSHIDTFANDESEQLWCRRLLSRTYPNTS